jgi:hypothetical protein
MMNFIVEEISEEGMRLPSGMEGMGIYVFMLF